MNRKSKFFVRLGRHGQYPKDDQAGGGTPSPTPAPSGDNPGGNSGAPGSESSGGDNTGEEFDPASFWTGPAPTPTPAPSGESAGTNAGESGNGGGGEDLNTVLSNQLNTMTFGEPIFNAEIAAEINEGNFSGIQKKLDGAMQAAVRNALSMNVQILRPFAEQLMTQMRDEFSGTLNTRDNSSALENDFPAAKKAAARPMIQQLYDQALKNTKGDRALAVKQTKGMLRFMAGATADDLDISVAPRGPDDSRPATPTNWLDELTGR